jgi:nucleotide-binding universal stress UspA family protein
MFKKILFCTDFSANSHWAFTYSLNLAKHYKSELFILHVTPVANHPEQLSKYLPPEKFQELMIARKNELEKELNTHYLRKLKEFKNYKVLFKEGEPFMEIIQMAKKESVDLIVMGTHGRTALDHVLFGSTAEKVVRKSPCPVLTIRLPGKRFKMP